MEVNTLNHARDNGRSSLSLPAAHAIPGHPHFTPHPTKARAQSPAELHGTTCNKNTTAVHSTTASPPPMDPDGPVAVAPASPPIWRWVLSFLAVGACWGLTTPFMRKAAVIRDKQPKQQRPYLTSDAPWISRKIWSILYAVMDLLRNPAYAIPLLLNVTGSVS